MYIPCVCVCVYVYTKRERELYMIYTKYIAYRQMMSGERQGETGIKTEREMRKTGAETKTEERDSE